MARCKDEIIIAALIANPTIKAASAACGVSETTIYERKRKPEFKEKYDAARLELMEQNSAKLQHHIGKAIDEMAAILDYPLDVASPQVRLNAAEGIIRNSLKLTEQMDILKRLEKLEQAAKSNDYL